MKTIQANVKGKSYPIYIGSQLLSHKELFKPYIQAKQAFIVTNTTIAPLYLAKLKHALTNYTVDALTLPDGEQYKTLATLNNIFDILLEKKHDRATTLLALGGGVIGDMTGFAAACYRRGVNYIQIPTTLLAAVDASVGGKTGINHKLGKNMIGAFYQPEAVVIDIDTLKTLPQREYKAGLAEVIKYALIKDLDFLTWLEKNMVAICKQEKNTLVKMITKCCQHKVDIVAIDEKERGERALLNLGHTFGHAIESATNYEMFLHGEAVAIGMLMAADLSMKHGLLQEEEYARILHLLTFIGLPVKVPDTISADKLYQLMQYDKKTLQQKMRLILLQGLGNAIICEEFVYQKLQQTLKEFCS